ncbi:MAG: hypothetical protein OEW05_00375 [Candidatus Aminicenantes bacterium]|nr:hypothetical protein [Candidatus Aminicenantes bacterium]
MKAMTQVIRLLGLAVLAIGLTSCNPMESESESASMLVVERMQGTTVDEQISDYVQSDVIIQKAGEETGTIVADIGRATMSCRLLAPAPPLGSSGWNDVVVTRYVVSYTRVDGRNTPGVDVPYPFEGSLSTVFKVGYSQEIAFVIVREVAKAEPPLIGLHTGGAEGVLQVTAKVEFYGHDMANKSVKATGYIPIFFANYANE